MSEFKMCNQTNCGSQQAPRSPRRENKQYFFKFTSSGVKIPERQKYAESIFFDGKMLVKGHCQQTAVDINCKAEEQ